MTLRYINALTRNSEATFHEYSQYKSSDVFYNGINSLQITECIKPTRIFDRN